jgi:hypothetical protein
VNLTQGPPEGGPHGNITNYTRFTGVLTSGTRLSFLTQLDLGPPEGGPYMPPEILGRLKAAPNMPPGAPHARP